jgi:hypothetical protein
MAEKDSITHELTTFPSLLREYHVENNIKYIEIKYNICIDYKQSSSGDVTIQGELCIVKGKIVLYYIYVHKYN